MNLTAINAKTGKTVLSLSGLQNKDSFIKTVETAFPNVNIDDLIIVADGAIVGKIPQPLPPQKSQHSVIWKGSFWDAGGYANMNREIVFRLLQRGISVKTDILKTAQQVDAATLSLVNSLSAIRLQNESSCPMVIGFTPMRTHGKRHVVFYTMMETQGLHNHFIDTCNSYASEIWTPCNFYVDVFKNAGIKKPIRLMPLGVNDKIYTPEAVEPNLIYEEMPSGKTIDHLPNKFRFMSLFGWSYRKGPDVLCRSFLKEFSLDDDVCLVIYSRYMGGSAEQHKDFIRKEIQQYYDEIKKENPPPIYYYGNEIPIMQLPGCYAAADCFVFCSRGEGFGLPVVEAGACEIPVISTYNTAMQQYLDDDTAFLVQTDELASANDKLTWISEFYRDQLFPVLGEKAVAEFGRLMRLVYSDPSIGKEKAEAFKRRIMNEYTWDNVADRAAKRIREI